MRRVIVTCLLLTILLAGCMDGRQADGPTINDMVMPTSGSAGTATGASAGADAVQAMAGTPSATKNAVGKTDTGTGRMQAAFKTCPALDSCQLDIAMKLDQTFTQGSNAFVVPFKLNGTVKSSWNPLVKMAAEVSSTSKFASEDMEYGAKLYMEQTQKEWITYSNETGKWAKTARNAADTPAVKISKADWEMFASAVGDAKAAGKEEVGGVEATKMEAEVPAKLVNKLFGAQLYYVIPGMQAAAEQDKSMPAFIWIGDSDEILQIQFNAGTAWAKVVQDSFSARSSQDFEISVKNVEITVTVTKLNSCKVPDIPSEARTAATAASPSPTAKPASSSTPAQTPGNT